MKKRWQDEEYGDRVRASIKASFDERWSDPDIQKKMIKVLTTYGGTSKLEKMVADIAVQYGYKPAVAVDRYLADLLNQDKKSIVEVNGDYWHCNPKTWKSGDLHPFKKITAQQVWDFDNERKNYLESLGYAVHVIWEQDIIKGKEKFIKDFLEKIK